MHKFACCFVWQMVWCTYLKGFISHRNFVFRIVYGKTLNRRDPDLKDIFSIHYMFGMHSNERASQRIPLHFVLQVSKHESVWQTQTHTHTNLHTLDAHQRNVSVHRVHNVQFSIIIFTSLRIVVSFGISII